MSKMCSLSKVMRSTDGEMYVNLMNQPKFYCKRCGRVANEKEYLCRPFPLFEEAKNEIKIKEVEIAVTRDGLHKHYVVEKTEEAEMLEQKNLFENNCSDDSEHQCNCTPESNCGDSCSCNDEKVVHVSDLFKNEDGTYSEEWMIEDEDVEPNDDFPAIEEHKGEPFIKSLKSSDKKDKKIKKMKMSELRNIIKEEVKKALAEQKK